MTLKFPVNTSRFVPFVAFVYDAHISKQDEDTAQNFVRVSHFQSKFDFIRQGSGPFRRLTIVGHD